MSVLRQADPRWNALRIGNKTMGRVGCLVTAICQAARHLHTVPLAEPPLLLDLGHKALGFDGNNAIIPILADCLGLRSSPAERVDTEDGIEAMRNCLKRTLEASKVCLVKVSVDGVGGHWILAFFWDRDYVNCMDPAPGVIVKLDPSTLTGVSAWGAVAKRYRVVAVQPVHKKEPHA